MDQTEARGYRIAMEKAGEGPAVLLLHGGLSDSREWRRQIRELTSDFTVIAWDAPGCRGSSDPPEDLQGYSSCLAGFIEGLELEHRHVVGLSFGPGLALELYRQRPDLPRSLVLASAYAGWAGSLPAEVVDARPKQGVRQYDCSWSGVINGEPASGSGRGTTVLQRSQDGWKVVHEHLSRGKFAA